MSDSYNANIYLKPSDLNNIEDRIEELTEECQERIFGKNDTTYSGTDFQIDTHDVIQGDLTQIDGQTSQNGTPTPESPIPVNVVSGRQLVSVRGKNFLKIFGETTTINGITFTQNSDGSISVSGTATADATYISTQTLPISEQVVYSLSGCPDGGSTSTYRLVMRFKKANGTNTATVSNTGGRAIATSPIDTTQILGEIWVYSGQTINLTFYPQLELGREQTTYEEYKGTDYDINLGKNLFNKNGSIISGGRLDNVGAIYYQTGYYTSEFIKVSPSTIYSKNSPTQDAYHRVCFYTSANVSSFISGANTNVNTFTTPSNAQYLRFCGLETEIDTAQLEKGSASSFSSYKTPIELCKIGNYQDFIRKGTGKNLFNSEMELGTIDNTTGVNANNSNCIRSINYISVQPNTTYTLSNTMNYHILIHEYGENQNYLQYTGNYGNPKTFTTTSNTYYIRVRSAAGQVENNLNAKYQLELGSQATYFEPYGYEGQWYIHKEIGRVVLTGASSENWARATTATTRSSFSTQIFTDRLTTSTASEFYSSNFYYRGNAQGTDLGYAMSFGQNPYTRFLYIQVPTNIVAPGEIANFKTWLGTHNTDVYYILNTPTNTLIEDEELINQLESIQLISGLNNIRVTSSNLSGIITIQSYLASFYRNIEVGDNLGGRTLYLSLPRTSYEDIPDIDSNNHYFITIENDYSICYKYYTSISKIIGLRYKDQTSNSGYLIKFVYAYSINTINPYLNVVRFKLPKTCGRVTSIDTNNPFYQYIKIFDEKLIPNYEKHTWVDNEPLTMQKIDHIEKGVSNIGLYYEKPIGWVNEKEWLGNNNSIKKITNYDVGVKTISYQDLNRWYNNLELIDFSDLNEITIWNAVNDISQIEWNGESDEEWVDNFNLVLYDFTTEDNNTLITENGDKILVLVNERV